MFSSISIKSRLIWTSMYQTRAGHQASGAGYAWKRALRSTAPHWPLFSPVGEVSAWRATSVVHGIAVFSRRIASVRAPLKT